MNEKHVVIEIRGGNLVAVYADDPNLKVRVLDWDNIKAGDTLDGEAVPVDSLSDLPTEFPKTVSS